MRLLTQQVTASQFGLSQIGSVPTTVPSVALRDLENVVVGGCHRDVNTRRETVSLWPRRAA